MQRFLPLQQMTQVLPTLPKIRLSARLPQLPRYIGLYLISAVIVAAVTLPILYLVIRAAEAGTEGIAYLLRPRTLTIVGNSLVLVAAVVAASAAIGIPFAWLTTRTNLPFRRVWLILGLLPMVIPSYIGAVTIVAVLGPVGYAQQLLAPLGIDRLPEIYGFFGAWLTITLFTYPYFVLPVRAALLKSDPALEEAAHSLGLSRWQVFVRVTLPLLRPALAAGALLTALYTLSDFGAVMVMRYNAFTRAIFTSYNSSFDRSQAAILSLVLVALTIGLLLAERRFAQHQKNYRIGTSVSRPIQSIKLGRWQIPALLFCSLLVTIGVLLPVGVLLSWALNSNVTSAVPIDLNELGWNTFAASGLTALVVGLAALPIAILGLRSSSRLSKMLVSSAYFGNVLPGLVVALALVFFASHALPAIYQTLPLLVLGYAVRFLPYSLAATRSALTQINPSIEDAARCLGKRPWQVTLQITMPLARAGILGGMALVFLNAMKELPTTLILAPIGFKTLATRIWTASENATLALVGLPGLVLMFVAALSLALILWREKY